MELVVQPAMNIIFILHSLFCFKINKNVAKFENKSISR